MTTFVAGLLFNSDKFAGIAELFTRPPCYGFMIILVLIEGGVAAWLTPTGIDEWGGTHSNCRTMDC